jgi:hypothetical protein
MLLGQHIKKKKNTDSNSLREVNLTSFEMAQLIHSYVDGSSFQDDQNMSRLMILIPSRVDHDFASLNGAEDADKDISELPLIPFTFKNRGYDNDFASLGSNAKYFTPYNSETTEVALTGFIRSFNTTMSGAEFPSVGFNLDFEEAVVLADNFLD